MNVFISNRLENLVVVMASRLNTPPSSILRQEVILVQSSGMAKWIWLQLAKYSGVAANYYFPFPNAFLEDIFQAFIPEYEKNPIFEEGVLVWRIFELLLRFKEHKKFIDIRNYLGEAMDHYKTYQLAVKIAHTFDQYSIFRPDTLLRWEEERNIRPEEEWQAILWRNIPGEKIGFHRAALWRKLIDAMKDKPNRPEILPERLSVFGISYLPPYHLDILVRLSERMPIDYYYLNPSREYWANIKSDREIARIIRKVPEDKLDWVEELHLETGNSLLASWGAQGREFFQLLEDLPLTFHDLFSGIERDTLLHKIQDDIYSLSEPLNEKGMKERIPFDDDTIQIHACYNPFREVEALHDILLSLFEKDSTIVPENVLVMTPDIETYAPYIEAVFEARDPKIPYSIEDRSLLAANVVATGLFFLLDLVETRFKASDVFFFLDNPAVSEKFEISAEDKELIQYWIDQTYIKWGIDETHRRSFNVPDFSQNTWRQGLNRLLAGIMFDGREPELYAGLLPYGEIESEQTEILGRFLSFWRKLTDSKNLLSTKHTLKEWWPILKRITEDFFSSSGQYRHEHNLVNNVLSRLSQDQRHTHCDTPLELRVIRHYLRATLNLSGGGTKFLSGGVSFCAMLPMRSIPFDVICIMGMNSDAYPRREEKTGFNLMDKERRVGDKSLRRDDQYLFLESILSARKSLIVTYVGLSQIDNKTLLPSVVVSDLMDYLDRNYEFGNSRLPSMELLRKHPLHAFSTEYFTSSNKLFSYSRPNYLSAVAMLESTRSEKVFLGRHCAELQISDKIISLDRLIQFYIDPIRYFLEQSLGLRLPIPLKTEDGESEPFHIDGLNAYRIEKDIIESYLKGIDIQKVFKKFHAQGILPFGKAGEYFFKEISVRAEVLAKDISEYFKSPELKNFEAELSSGEYQIYGTVDRLRRDYRISYSPGRLRMKDFLSIWINHLILNIAQGEAHPKKSILIGKDGKWFFDTVAYADEILQTLIQYYSLGLTKPLKFFQRSSWAYALALWQKNKSRDVALKEAQRAWKGHGNDFIPPDSKNLTYKICFDNIYPIDDEFQKTAEDILKNLFSHAVKLEN